MISNTVHVPVREKARLHQSGTVLPTVDWQNKQVSDFSKVRMKLARHTAYIQKHRGSEDRKHKLPSKTNEQGKIKRNPISGTVDSHPDSLPNLKFDILFYFQL